MIGLELIIITDYFRSDYEILIPWELKAVIKSI